MMQRSAVFQDKILNFLLTNPNHSEWNSQSIILGKDIDEVMELSDHKCMPAWPATWKDLTCNFLNLHAII
eukprot:c44985_g1_i1 orf=185-394(+)